jgi:hypothetical protein
MYWRTEGLSPHVLKLGTKWRLVVCFTPPVLIVLLNNLTHFKTANVRPFYSLLVRFILLLISFVLRKSWIQILVRETPVLTDFVHVSSHFRNALGQYPALKMTSIASFHISPTQHSELSSHWKLDYLLGTYIVVK